MKDMSIKATQIRVNNLCVVSTANGSGIAVKPLARGLQHYEVCICVRKGVLDITVHIDGVDDPVSSYHYFTKNKGEK